jgi:hypothetical protein
MNYVQSSIAKTNLYSYYLPTLVPTNVIYRGLLGYDVISSDVVLKVNNSQGHTVPSAVYVAANGNRLYNTRYHNTEEAQ